MFVFVFFVFGVTVRQRRDRTPSRTLRMNFCAECDMRIRSHQAGQRVFMYCVGLVYSSL